MERKRRQFEYKQGPYRFQEKKLKIESDAHPYSDIIYFNLVLIILIDIFNHHQKFIILFLVALSQIEMWSQQAEKFCYLFIKYKPEAILGIFFGILPIIFLAYSLNQYLASIKAKMMNGLVKLIYISIFLWAITNIVKFSWSQTLYWFSVLSRGQDHTSYNTQTKIIYGFDILSSFFLQSSLLLTWYIWTEKIQKIFLVQNSILGNDSQESIRQNENDILFQKYCSIFLKKYLLIRLFYVGVLITFFCFARNQFVQRILYKILMAYKLFQAFIIVALVTIGTIFTKKNRRLREIIDQSQLYMMIRKYTLLLLCSLARFTLDLIYYIVDITKVQRFKASCYIVSDPLQEVIISFIRMFLYGLLAHCSPIFVVLKVFRVTKKGNQCDGNEEGQSHEQIK